jgi:hypothetical protein
MIPISAFQEIIKELERLPIQKNYYRKKVGEGRSQAFGVVGKRGIPNDYSRHCWNRPYLYKLLLDFAEKYVDLSFNSITVNQNYAAEPHRDRNNIGESYLVAFGDYTGGELKIYEGDLSGNHNVCRNPIQTNFSAILHSVEPFKGNRYSLVYYYYHNNYSVPLPPPYVRLDGDEWFFYRGEEKIQKETGLPHPRRGLKVLRQN